MSTYDEYLVENDRVDIDINAGKCVVRLDDKKVFEGKYVIGDIEDKMRQNLLAYRALLEALLETDEEGA